MQAKSIWIGRVISGLPSLLFAMGGILKLMGVAQVMDGMAHVGLPEALRIPLGILELLCVAVFLIPATAVTGAILLTGYIGGTIITHLRVDEPVFMQTAMGIFVWFGLYLRDQRVRELIPVTVIHLTRKA